MNTDTKADEEVARLLAAAVATERERAAKVCERRADSLREGGAVARQCARDIRNGIVDSCRDALPLPPVFDLMG